MGSKRNLVQLAVGEEAVICCLLESESSSKLMEMGCIPGTKLKMEQAAPLGDPIRILVDNEYSLALRKAEAKLIMLD